jgi:hypothetical protein
MRAFYHLGFLALIVVLPSMLKEVLLQFTAQTKLTPWYHKTFREAESVTLDALEGLTTWTCRTHTALPG